MNPKIFVKPILISALMVAMTVYFLTVNSNPALTQTFDVVDFAWSPNGELLAVSVPGLTSIYDSELRLLHEFETTNLSDLEWSSDSTRLAYFDYVTNTSVIRIWSLSNNSVVQEIPIPIMIPEIPYLSWNPQGTLISVAGEGGLHIWNAGTGHLDKVLLADENFFGQSAWSPDGMQVAVAAPGRAGEGKILIWDYASGQLLKTLQDSGGYASMIWTSDGHIMGNGIDSIEVWEVQNEVITRRLIPVERGVVANAIASANGRVVAAVSNGDGTVNFNVWDIASGELLDSIGPHVGPAYFPMEISPDGTRIPYWEPGGALEIISIAASE